MTDSLSTNVSFQALSIVTGKGVTQADKIKAHIHNGAHVGALLAVSVGRKAIIDQIGQEGLNDTIHKLAHGNIIPASALVTAKSGKAVSLMLVDGKAPYSEWLRMGATLRSMVQVTEAGKPTSAAKSLELWEMLTSKASALRNEQQAAKALQAA